MAHLADIGGRVIDVANNLDASLWPDSESRERLDEVLAYVQLMIEGSQGALVSHPAGSELEATLTEFVNAPEQLAQESGPWIDRLLDAAARLPRSQGRDFEQAAKDGAKTFQRSARQRFAAVETRAQAALAETQALTEALEARRAEIDGIAEQFRAHQDEVIETRFAQLDSRTQDLQAAAERHAQNIEALMTEQSEAFRKVQDERADEHREQEQKYGQQFDTLQAETKARVGALIAEIEAMKSKSAEMVGAIGITGTAERYGREFDAQQEIANIWRRVTLGIGGLAVIVAIIAAFDHKATTAGTKLAIAILLGGVAAYTAKQSARHRSREERARRLQLDLTAFPVFIEALPEADRDAATVWMAERSFLGAKSVAHDEDDGGPSLLSQFVARRKKPEGEES